MNISAETKQMLDGLIPDLARALTLNNRLIPGGHPLEKNIGREVYITRSGADERAKMFVRKRAVSPNSRLYIKGVHMDIDNFVVYRVGGPNDSVGFEVEVPDVELVGHVA